MNRLKPGNIFRNKTLNNASWIVGIRVVQSALTLLVTMLTARYLGPSNYGLLGYVQSVVSFAAPIALLGLSNVMVQELVNAPEEEGEIVGTAIVLSAISALMCMGGCIAFCAIVNHDRITTIVCALYSIYLISQSVVLIQYWFQAKLISKYSSIVSLLVYILISAYKIFLLATGKSIYWFAITSALDNLLISFFLVIIYVKLGGRKLSFSSRTAQRMFSKSKYYIVTNMMIAVFAQTDRIMLKLMIDDAATGYYSAAAYCAGCVGFVYSAITDSARPTIFESKKQNQVKFERNVSRLYCIVMYLSLVQSVLMTAFAPVIVKCMYGQDYLPAIPILRLVVWYITFSEIGVIRNIWVLAEGKQKWLWIINLSGALANVIMNYLLIPIWGAMGAAFASLMTQFFANVVVSYIIKPIRPNTRLMVQGWDIRLIREMLHVLKKGGS